MTHQQTEDGILQPVLPVSQLEEIFDRIVRDEIIVSGESTNKDFAVSRGAGELEIEKQCVGNTHNCQRVKGALARLPLV